MRYPNVFSLGDVSSTPNSKTAAAVRKQAPVVVDNILHMMGKTVVGVDRRLCVMPTDHSFRQGHLGGVHLRREGRAYPALNPAKEYLGWLVDQSDRPAVDVLELHVEGARVVPPSTTPPSKAMSSDHCEAASGIADITTMTGFDVVDGARSQQRGAVG